MKLRAFEATKPEMGVRRWVEWAGPGASTERIVEAVREIRPEGRYILNHFTDQDPEYHTCIQYYRMKFRWM